VIATSDDWVDIDALKGVLGNLALTPMNAPSSELTERLRAGTAENYEPYLREILSQRDKMRALCA